jgi:hypothetical protein
MVVDYAQTAALAARKSPDSTSGSRKVHKMRLLQIFVRSSRPDPWKSGENRAKLHGQTGKAQFSQSFNNSNFTG